MLRSLFQRLLRYCCYFVALSVLLVLSMRWIPPVGSGMMIERKVESWINGEPVDLQRTWRSWSELPDNLKIAVIAAEDQKFAEHWGFDIAAIRAAIEHNQSPDILFGHELEGIQHTRLRRNCQKPVLFLIK